MSPKFHRLLVSDVREETEDTISVAFHVPADLKQDYAYFAGQYLTIKADVNGEELRRSYSICTAPIENELRVAIKKVEDGRFSTWANENIKKNDHLEIMTPMGHFLWKKKDDEPKNYMLVASGSGITPMMAIAKSILSEEEASFVTLLYGNKGFSSIIFREEIESLKNLNIDRFRVIHVLSRESLGNPLQKGRIDSDKFGKIKKAYFDQQFIDGVFICGPEEMILGVKNMAIEQGILAENIHFELFGTAPKKKETVSIINENNLFSKVRIILDGDEIDFELDTNGINLLDAGFKAGADLPYACKGGVCCTCKARIIEGSASMDINYALDKEEVEAGFILTCQAHPTSEKLIVSFDD